MSVPDADSTIKKITLNPVSNAEGETLNQPNKTRRRNRKAPRNVSAEPGTKVIVTKDMGSTSTAVANATNAPTQAAGGATSPGTLVQLASTHVSGSNSSKATGAMAPLSAIGAPVGGAGAPVDTGVPTGGASTPVKVVLTQSRKKKVLLAAPKKAVVAHEGSKHKTAKKIHVSLKGLGSGLRRAKTIRKKASKHTIEEIKKGLIEAKLIKSESKAPEGILRQMYADYMVLKKKAL